MFIRAKHLIGMPGGVRWAQGRRKVRYFHLLLPRHQIVFAEGTASESFYPGFESLMTVKPKAFERLKKVLPDVESKTPHEFYGPTARPFLAGQDAKRLLTFSGFDGKSRNLLRAQSKNAY